MPEVLTAPAAAIPPVRDYVTVETTVIVRCLECGQTDCATATAASDRIGKEIAERARLERLVIEAAKAYGRANQAVEDHMKKSTEADGDSADGWQQLRDLESTWEEMLLEAIKPLLDFESKQQQIKQ